MTDDKTCPFDAYTEEQEVTSQRLTPSQIKKLSKEEKFVYYAEKRVNTILKELESISNMASTYAGYYNKQMIEEMFYTIKKATDASSSFYHKKALIRPTFSFTV